MPDQPGFPLCEAIGEVVADEQRTDDAALIVAHSRNADLQELTLVMPNAVPRGSTFEKRFEGQEPD